MLVLINGLAKDSVSVQDRGFLYGDGAFETLTLRNNEYTLLDAHLERLERACQVLRLPLPRDALDSDLGQLKQLATGDGVCKIILTRGATGRGYRAASTATVTRVVQWFEQSLASPGGEGITTAVSSHRLSHNSHLAGIKHLNRLDQVMASFDLSQAIDEVICLDQEGLVIEGSRSNLIMVKRGRLYSPNLSKAGVRGIMLAALADQFAAIGNPIEFADFTMDDIYDSAELFFCNSVFGVWPVLKLLEGASVRQWTIGEVSRQAIAFQHELFGTHD